MSFSNLALSSDELSCKEDNHLYQLPIYPKDDRQGITRPSGSRAYFCEVQDN